VGRREEARQAKHEAILSATTDAIASHGLRGLRVHDVADAAGVSVALLYYHFGSRLGLAQAALRHAHARAPSTQALGDPPPGTSAFAVLESALLAELDDAGAVRDFAIVWGEAMTCAVFEAGLREDVGGVCTAWSADVARLIADGIADGSIAAGVDPGLAAEALTTLVDGLCARWLAGVLELARARAVLASTLRSALLDARAVAARG
jgi:AcrR family transcriptional regulator